MKTSSIKFLFVMTGALALAACGASYPGGAAACAGINQAEIAYDAKSGQMQASLCGGKENESVKLSGVTPNGVNFLYEAQGSKAFDGQMTQAELQQALGRERNETIRELITSLRQLSPIIPGAAR